jgi:hypothetical protein
MRCQYQHLGNLYVLRSIGGIYGNVGNIITRQGFDALIYRGGPVVITVESDIAEVRFCQSLSPCRHSRQTSLHKRVLSRLLLQ